MYPKLDIAKQLFLFCIGVCVLMMLSSPIVAMRNRYLIDFSEWEVFVNDDCTRSFLSVEVRKEGLAEVGSKSSFSCCFAHFLLVFSSFWGSSIVGFEVESWCINCIPRTILFLFRLKRWNCHLYLAVGFLSSMWKRAIWSGKEFMAFGHFLCVAIYVFHCTMLWTSISVLDYYIVFGMLDFVYFQTDNIYFLPLPLVKKSIHIVLCGISCVVSFSRTSLL